MSAVGAVWGSASSIPFSPSGRERGDTRSLGGGVEPSTEPVVVPVSRELGDAIAAAHVAWARRYAPHLLEEWLDG